MHAFVMLYLLALKIVMLVIILSSGFDSEFENDLGGHLYQVKAELQ